MNLEIWRLKTEGTKISGNYFFGIPVLLQMTAQKISST